MTTPLISPRSFLTSLLKELPKSNPHSALDQETPPSNALLLSLHALLPSTFLPALDLLDRNLVTRYLASEKTYFYRVSNPPLAESGTRGRKTAYSRSTGRDFEVRTLAWSCDCPAFAFASYFGCGASQETDVVSGSVEDSEQNQESVWGGLSLHDNVSVCKHLLACVLAENWAGMLSSKVVTVDLSLEQYAGKAAGWMD